MKKSIRNLSVVCACTMLASSFVACSPEDPSKTLYIDIGNAGYGIEWLNPLKETFEAEHEGFTVKISSITKGDNEYLDKATSGSAETDIFLYRVGVQKVVLKNESEHRGEFLVGIGANIPPVYPDYTRVGIVKAHKKAKKGGFSASRGADNSEALASF